MSILNGTGATEPKEIWYGNNKIKEVWVGGNKVWPLLQGAYADADLYLNFNNSNNVLENLGVEGASVLSEGGMLHEHDNLFVANTGKFRTFSDSTWASGYTVSMWTRDVPVNSGWSTIVHRAPTSGTVTYEAYVAQNTNASTTTIHSGLRLNNVAREYAATYQPPVGSDWFHTAVVWSRTSSTAFNCRFYIDGILRGSFNATGFPANVQLLPSYPIFFGSPRDNGKFEWSGSMDDVALWSRPLSSAEVNELYILGRSRLPQIITPGPLSFVVGQSGGMYLVADFETTSWSATGLPNGITLSPAGYLSGSATTEGWGTMTVVANGANGLVVEKTYSWIVESSMSPISVPFNSNGDIDYYFPIRGFDGRTSASSPRNAGWTFSGMLVAGDNNQPTYWQILHDKQASSETANWSLTMGNSMNTVARPTEIILSSDANLQNQLLLQIGSGNLDLVYRTTGGTTALRTQARTITNGTVISVQRNGLSYTVYDDNVAVYTYTGTTSNAAAWFRTPGRAYTGITMYSTSGQWSSRVSHFSVS